MNLEDLEWQWESVKKIILSKWYDKGPHDQALVEKGKYGEFVEKIVDSSKNVLNCYKWVVGRGSKVRFWQDVWCEDERFQTHFPLTFAIARDKELSVEKTFGDASFFAWEIMASRNLQDWEIEEFEQLLQVLANIQLSSEEDKLSWKLGKRGVFTINSFYSHVEDFVPINFPLKLIWNLKPLLEYLFLLGKLLKNKSWLPTT